MTNHVAVVRFTRVHLGPQHPTLIHLPNCQQHKVQNFKTGKHVFRAHACPGWLRDNLPHGSEKHTMQIFARMPLVLHTNLPSSLPSSGASSTIRAPQPLHYPLYFEQPHLRGCSSRAMSTDCADNHSRSRKS
jgi:hypothetical protein